MRHWRLLLGLALPVGAVLLAWGGYAWTVYSSQEALLFQAPGGVDTTALDAAAEEVGARSVTSRATDGTELYGWHRRANGTRAILYFHGNAESVAQSMGLLRVAQRNGWDWVAFAYRGYPGSSGTPSEAGITLDARAAWDFVVEELGIGPDRIVLHGRSLGGAVAATLAEEVQPAGLVLESTPRSVLELAIPQAPGLPVGALLKHPFRTDLRAPGIRTPTLVVHSSDDHVVPVEHGRWLASTIPDAQLLEVTGHRHGELLPVRNPSIRQAWLAFLDARCPPVRANPAPP